MAKAINKGGTAEAQSPSVTRDSDLDGYDFEREREYLEVLRKKIRNTADHEESQRQFVEHVRQEVEERLEALTQ